MLITEVLLSFWNNGKSQNGLHMQHTSPKADVLKVQTGMLEFFQNDKEERILLRAGNQRHNIKARIKQLEKL